MKRSFAVIRALMLCVALLFAWPSVSAEAMSDFGYTDDLLEDGSLIYYFEELSLQLPAEWRGSVMALQENNGVAFYQKASYDKYKEEGIDGGGFLFRLGASVNSSFSELPAFEYLGFSEESAMNYYLELPSDYPAYFEEDIRAEYDAMAGEIDYVVEHARFYADNNAADADPAAEVASWTPAEVRYQFEHSMLPRYFYESPGDVLAGIAEMGIYRLWEAVTTENGVDPTYPEEEYTERWYTAEDGTTVLQIELPRPDENLLCYRIYFVYGPGTGNAGYYTVEYDDFLTETAFLCTWDAERSHAILDETELLDRASVDYGAALTAEAQLVGELAGVSGRLVPADPNAGELAVISCPELGFSTMADPAYSWDYQEGTGVSIYTERADSIPHVIVWQSEDRIAEPLEYIKERFTPYMEEQYGDDLVAYTEYEFYAIGGKQLPAGLYTYRLQGYLVDLLRLYDSTGDRTAAYTAKYIRGEEEATLAALDTAIRYFRAE